jgi:hypothetical protein
MLVALLAVVGQARAQDACRGDVERLCPGIAPGGGRISACLHANQAQVSTPCKAELASVARKAKEVGTACADDVASYCAGVATGQGAVLRCLSENKATLSPPCQQILRGAQEKAAEFKKSCGKDVRKLCKGVAPGEGRVLACLESKKAELSPACRGLMGN